MAQKKYYKFYIIDKDNKQQFNSGNFKTKKDAIKCFKTFEHLAKRAYILEYKNDINERSWVWSDECKEWE